MYNDAAAQLPGAGRMIGIEGDISKKVRDLSHGRSSSDLIMFDMTGRS